MSEYTIRLVEGDADYEFGVDLMNACFGEKLSVEYNIDQIREWWKQGDNPLGRVYIVEIDGQPNAVMRFFEIPSDDRRLRIYFNVTIMPEYFSATLLHELFTRLQDFAAEYKPDELRMSVLEFEKDYLALMEAHGYTRIQRDQISSLYLNTIDFDAFAEVMERVETSGIRLVTLPEYEQENREYKAAIVDLSNSIYRDVPGFGTSAMTLEQFEEQVFRNQTIVRKAWILALDGQQPVGMTYVTRFGNDEDCLTNLTGVIRSHRRRGVTTAMKVRSFEILRDIGFKRILTGNEENNPMYQINLKFGFEPGPAAFLYTKQMTTD